MHMFGSGSGRGRRFCGILSAGAVVMALARPAAAQGVGDAGAGHDLARTVCGSCHNVEPSIDTSEDHVPTFAAIARMPSTTQLSLQVFLQTPHWPMPNLLLTHDEIDNIAAYILSMRKS
jgi:mono/diheme cytochrome c family protein